MSTFSDIFGPCLGCRFWSPGSLRCKLDECALSFGPCSLCSSFDHDYGTCTVDNCSYRDYWRDKMKHADGAL